MTRSLKPVRIRIEIGRPKRKSGVYVTYLPWGYHNATRRKEKGILVDLKTFHEFQIQEGPDIFDGLNFKLIPYERNNS